ncbi:MAG: hypothetical protein B7Y39_12190 [Bdellovibrio sp. 28-41-41]|nr:MAG: hypothetical protein B7Y39_12190 [Bdellovibrio sp. 28-41-41]
MKRWFVQVGTKIHGPLSINEVEKWHTKHKECLVWGKGMAEWVSHFEWKLSLEEAAEKDNRISLWQYRINDKESKILKLDELIADLRVLQSYDNIYVKSDLDSKWQILFASSAVTERLGITRRTQLRVPIFGFFEGLNLTTNVDLRCKLLTLSEGGCGFTDALGLKIGHSLRGQIISPNLNQNITITGDVVYSGSNGDLGVKFSILSQESKSLVLDYVIKFKGAEA